MIEPKTIEEFNRVEDEYLSRYNAYIMESTESHVIILYGKFLQYDITIKRPHADH